MNFLAFIDWSLERNFSFCDSFEKSELLVSIVCLRENWKKTGVREGQWELPFKTLLSPANHHPQYNKGLRCILRFETDNVQHCPGTTQRTQHIFSADEKNYTHVYHSPNFVYFTIVIFDITFFQNPQHSNTPEVILYILK